MAVVLALAFGLAMTGWVAVDADRRGRNWFAWAVLTALTGIVGLVLWLHSRRRSAPLEERRRVGRQLAIALVAVPLLAATTMITGFVLTYLFQVARIEGQAMAPTLLDRDRVIVNKLAYQAADPRVFDIVMHRYPLKPEKLFVKRIIAEQGDQIRIVKGRVYRNDIAVQDDYVPAEFRSHDNWGPEVIPEGYYFVLGDHRNNSSDSRHWRYVPKKYILGKVQCRWWPVSTARCF